ncbi:hypothetical protein AXJ14_gp127 [Geobacillus virus E3]|nr:hypothetical protein AXJ14_gp127 [Geobacillus virus E3]AJA41446.1 hypothetical protein E3_0127 [Geobacillus virus E3]
MGLFTKTKKVELVLLLLIDIKVSIISVLKQIAKILFTVKGWQFYMLYIN